MKTKHQYLLVIFWVALIVDCFFVYKKQDANHIYAKTLLMPLLAIYFLANVHHKSHLSSKILVIVALFFAWVGDVLVLNPQSSWYNLDISICAFMLVHLTHIIYFLRVNKLFPIQNPWNVWVPLFSLGIYDIGLMYFLISRTGNLEKLLVPYMVILSVMFIAACNVRGSKKAGSLANQFFIPGAVFFVGSDTIVGLNIFVFQDNMVNIAGLITYAFAQAILVEGFTREVRGRA